MVPSGCRAIMKHLFSEGGMIMRMWNVHPGILCRQHLLGEHCEMHMFLGSIKKGIGLKGYIAKGQVEVHNIRLRHDELATEMLRRGYNHRSPMLLDEQAFLWVEGKVNVEYSLTDLAHRCSRCAARMRNL